jgi:hypothetical protein
MVRVLECPIVPGNSFLYEFTTPTQAGTFWYIFLTHSYRAEADMTLHQVSFPLRFVVNSLENVHIIKLVVEALQYCDGLRGPLVSQ